MTQFSSQTAILKIKLHYVPSQIVLCSSSFSFGLNVSDIKYVVHYVVPSPVEGSMQEVGWAEEARFDRSCNPFNL